MKRKIIICALILITASRAVWSLELEVTATSTLEASARNSYQPEQLFDGTWRSWSEGVPGDGIGQKITVRLKNKSLTLNEFFIRNGYGNLKYYTKNNRVKLLKVSDEHGHTALVELADTPFRQVVKPGGALKGSVFSFEIAEVYKGETWDDTCISEISFERPRGGFTEYNGEGQAGTNAKETYSGDIQQLYKSFLRNTLKYDVKIQAGVLRKLMQNDCNSDNPNGSEYQPLKFFGNTVKSDWSTCNTGGGTFAQYCSLFMAGNKPMIIVLHVEKPDYGGNTVIYYVQQGGGWQKKENQLFPMLKIIYFLNFEDVSYQEYKDNIAAFVKDSASNEKDQRFSFQFTNIRANDPPPLDGLSVTLPNYMQYQLKSEYKADIKIKQLYLVWDPAAAEFLLKEQRFNR